MRDAHTYTPACTQDRQRLKHAALTQQKHLLLDKASHLTDLQRLLQGVRLTAAQKGQQLGLVELGVQLHHQTTVLMSGMHVLGKQLV